jgi:hypothetical protein
LRVRFPESEDPLLPTSWNGTPRNSHTWTVHITFPQNADPSTALVMTEWGEDPSEEPFGRTLAGDRAGGGTVRLLLDLIRWMHYNVVHERPGL